MIEDVKWSYLYKWDSSRLNNACGICKLGLIGVQLPIVKSKAEIVSKVEFQTPFSHNRMIFFKTIWTKEIYIIKLVFISKNPFRDLSKKLWEKFGEVVWKCQSKFSFNPF